ncbi:hypothetical protein V6C27_13830 [Peptococcaceae bacterium 1198_IL3148]
MLKKLINCLLILTLIITAVPNGAAFALPSETENPQQEQLIHQQVIMGYFDVWKGSTWQDTNNDGDIDARGDKNKPTKPFTYTLEDKVKEGWTITRVEVQYPFSADDYVNAGGRMSDPAGNPLQSMMPYQRFKDNYLKYLPQSLSVSVASQDLVAGKAQVQWKLDLEYLDQNYSLDLTDSSNRTKIGYEVKDIEEMVEGWRWYLPGIIKWYAIPPTELPNIMVGEIEPGVTSGEAVPGTLYSANAEIVNESDQSFTNVPVAAYNNGWQAKVKDQSGNLVSTINLGPNETKVININYTAQDPTSAIKVVVDTAPLPETIEEQTKEDNVGEIEVLAKVADPPPMLGGDIKFKAVNQTGTITRPAGTAKWTDKVTATINPPAPKAPRGSITSWNITSATLTIPAKNPKFTFGNPLPPQGTKTLNMSTGGHSSSVTFQEDWAMDGAKIYNQVTQKMMAVTPKNYPITAKYTIHYTYEYQVKHRSCSKNSEGKRRCKTWYETKTGSGSTSGTLSGNLYVNGTGVNSRAQ